MILAIVLSAIVLFGWSFISDRYFPTASEPSTRIVEGKQVPIPQPDEDPTADAPVAVRDRQAVLAETPRVAIETPRLRSEEHTSELQSLMRHSYAVFCLKKKNKAKH